MSTGHSCDRPDPASRADRVAEVRDILRRFEFEHDLLVKRTAAFLAMNGLMAASVAAGEKMPAALKLFVAVVMILANVAWLRRAASVGRFIASLSRAAYSDTYRDVLPADAVLHKAYIADNRRTWFTMTVVFSLGIPCSLLFCWLGGIVIVLSGAQ